MPFLKIERNKKNENPFFFVLGKKVKITTACDSHRKRERAREREGECDGYGSVEAG